MLSINHIIKQHKNSLSYAVVITKNIKLILKYCNSVDGDEDIGTSQGWWGSVCLSDEPLLCRSCSAPSPPVAQHTVDLASE